MCDALRKKSKLQWKPSMLEIPGIVICSTVCWNWKSYRYWEEPVLEKGHMCYTSDKLQSTEVCNTTTKPKSRIWREVQDLFALLSFSLVSANFYLLTSFLNCTMEVGNLFVFYSCPQLRVKRDFGLWTLVTVGTVTILWTLEVELNVFHIWAIYLNLWGTRTTTKK